MQVTPLAPPSVPRIAQPVTVEATPRKFTVRGSFSTPSILAALRDEPLVEDIRSVAETDSSDYGAPQKEKPFLQQELLEAWKGFVTTITDAPQLKSALGAREPKLTGQWQIEYELDTELQYNRLTADLKPKLLGFLRRKFDNESIEINFSVSEQINQSAHIPYTDEERWNLLVTKYPSLAGLKAKFGLDFEHY